MSADRGARLGGGCGRQGSGSVGDGRLVNPANGVVGEAAAEPPRVPPNDGAGDDGKPNGDGDDGGGGGDGPSVPGQW